MAGMSNFLRNKIHDWLHRGQAYSPPATIYVALCTSAPSASIAGTEVAGAGYARVALPQDMTKVSGTQGSGTTTVSTGTGGEVSNNVAVDFGTAGADWGSPDPVGWWETYDAASGGNRLEYGTIVNGSGVASPRTIVTGDPVSFPIGALKFRIA